LGTEWGYEPSGGIVYYKIRRNRFEYHPDVLWLYNCGNRFKPCAFVWEIESCWVDLKKIAGDTILAFMMQQEHTTFFKSKDETTFGRLLKSNVTVPAYHGGDRATYYKDWHKQMNLDATHVILVMEYEGDEDYWRRYVHSIANHVGFNGECDVISVPRGCVSIADVKHRLAHLKFLRQIA
jgi:hypothetical protein